MKQSEWSYLETLRQGEKYQVQFNCEYNTEKKRNREPERKGEHLKIELHELMGKERFKET